MAITGGLSKKGVRSSIGGEGEIREVQRIGGGGNTKSQQGGVNYGKKTE